MRSKNKYFYAAIIGNILEYYDVALYGLLFPKLAVLFFPHEDPTISMLWGLGVFASGFIMRPLGGALFGHIGDRLGRRKVLTLSIALTSIPALIIGMLPTYAQIGMIAPVILVMCRLAHGLCIGGESAGILVYVLEKTQPNKANFVGSILCSVSFVGVLVGAAVSALCTHASMPEWGWRIPFLITILLALYGYYFRKRLQESELFKTAKAPIARVPLITVMKESKRNLLCTFGLGAACSVPYHVFTIYVTSMMSSTLKIPLSQVIIFNMSILGLLTIILPFMGMWADRTNNVKLMHASMAAISILAYPVFLLIGSHSLPLIIVGQIILVLAYSGFLASVSAFLVSLFPVRTRSTGIGVAYNFGNCVFGGTTPLIATQLVYLTGNPRSPAIYLFVAGLIGIASVAFAKDTSLQET
jgi:MHS family proline/betaine transporter-like MFS transporter